MNQVKFAEIEACNSWKELELPKWTCILKDDGIRKYVLRHLPHVVEPIFYHLTEGCRIILPILKPIQEKDQEFVQEVLHSFNEYLMTYDVKIANLQDELLPYKNLVKALVPGSEGLGILFIKQVLEGLQGKLNKNSHYIIVDGRAGNTEYIIDQIYENINFLTIVTDTPERYQEKQKAIYEETGLALEIKDKNLQQTILGDVFIHTQPSGDKLFFTYQNDAIVVDFLTEIDVLKNMKTKKPKLTMVYDFTSQMKGQRYLNLELLTIMLCENRWIRSLFQNGYQSESRKKITKILQEDYPLEIMLRTF